VAHLLIERLRQRLPWVRRLHREIDDLRHRLAAAESKPLVRATAAFEPMQIGAEFRALLHFLEPHDVPGRRKLRVGGEGDGGYVMLDDFAPVRHALSLGVGPDVSWDSAVAERGLRVFQYDDTVEASPRAHQHFVFHRNHVVAQAKSPEDVTLQQILGSEALAGDNEIVAKIDIEGCEWDILAATPSKDLARIRQLAVEFHRMRDFSDLAWRRTAFAALRNLAATHCCIHIHGNNWVPFTVVGGVPFPDGFEATFVRRADHAAVPSTAIFPTELDRPCDPKRPDLYLGRWNY